MCNCLVHIYIFIYFIYLKLILNLCVKKKILAVYMLERLILKNRILHIRRFLNYLY